MDKTVDKFLKAIGSMDTDELQNITKILNNTITYQKDIETLEDKVVKKDRERFKALRQYESKVKELSDIDDRIKKLQEELVKQKTKKAKIKEEIINYRKISDKASREFLNTKKELKERRKLGVSRSTVKTKKSHKKITISDFENSQITINGATSITKINNIFKKKENTTSKRK